MGKVTGAWERPIQGVSQQSDKDRIDGQCTLQENLIPSPLNGLIKRTGTRFVSEIANSVQDNTLWYSYNRGDEESYFIMVEPNSSPRVFDIEGNERVVNITGGNEDYYKVSNPVKDLRLSTIADFSFILNTKKIANKTTARTGENPNTAIVYCQYATYARDYIITIDGLEVAKYTTPDGSEAEHASSVKTNFIAEKLADQINNVSILSENVPAVEVVTPPVGSSATVEVSQSVFDVFSCYNITQDKTIAVISFLGTQITIEEDDVDDGDIVKVDYSAIAATEYTAELKSNTIFVTKNTGEAFVIETTDSSNGNDLVAVQDTVKQLTNLPPYAPDDYVVKVLSREGYDADAYWLKAESVPTDNEQTGSNIRWVETVAQDTEFELDKDTLPHTLISEADGTFTLDTGSWENRRVGDDNTNPFPSFVGTTINSIGTFQNRILFTSGEAAIFSRTNNFFDFFRETTQVESIGDPVDGYADTDEINNLVHHAVLDGDIIFFAENGQFLIDGSKPLTKDNLTFKRVTSYPMNTLAKPAVTGESVMFSFKSGKYAGIREMFTDSFTDTKRARPVTEHVAEYIEGTPIDLIASPNINTLFVLTDINRDTLYVYDWLWIGDQKAQSAMHTWKLDGIIEYVKFIQDRAYFVIRRSTGVYLEYMPISSDSDDNGLDFPLRLDQRSTVSAVYNNFRWEFSLPYEVSDYDKLRAVRGEGCWDADKGTSVIFENDGNDYWTYDDLADLSENTTCTLNVGTVFTSKYIPTRPYLKDQNGRAIGLDRFTLAKVTMNYASIGNTLITVRDIRARREWRYEYNGRMMGGWNNRVGFAPLDSGSFSFPVRMESAYSQLEISTDDYRPFILRDMEWEGMFKQRGRRL